VRAFFLIVVAVVAIITANLWINLSSQFESIWEALRHAAFNVASLISTTGFSSADFNLWPALSQTLLILVLIIGGCAGSTAGGLKCIRAMLLFKGIKRNISQIIRPQRIKVVRVNDKTMDEKLLSNTNAYFATYILIILVSFVVISVDGFSLMTNFSAVVSCFNNTGPGFEAVGPACNFADFSWFSKLILSIDMLAGRLEIFPILILFNFHSWRRH
jgi:trk system potassium uptake protein TrkH